MKKISFFLAAMCLLAFSGAVWAADSSEAFFKEECGSCHMRGGAAAPVNPGDKAGSVWVKYFKRGRHPVELDLSPDEVDMIVEYLENHAADSDQPQMSVIPQ